MERIRSNANNDGGWWERIPSMTALDDELARRLSLWAQVSAAYPANADPGTLRSLLVYGGAQGIWVDRKKTGSISGDGHGVTVSILHTNSNGYLEWSLSDQERTSAGAGGDLLRSV
jgi:hypothetical protein